MKESNKTRPTQQSVEAFIASIDNPQQRQDAKRLATIMQEVTGKPPVMWGSSIVGYGQYHYKYASGREDDWLAVGFAPRANSLTLYLYGLEDQVQQLDRLGPYKTGKACLYIKRLADVDEQVLRQLIADGYAYAMSKMHTE